MPALNDYAKRHKRQNRLRRSYEYAANRFVRACGPIDVEDLTTDLLEKYRDWCVAQNLRPATIEGSIRELIALHHAATGVRLNPGSKLRVPRPQPQPPSLDAISAVYAESPAWVRQYLAVAFWTCLRVADALRLQASLSGPSDALRWTASKTGHSQAWPVPAWLQRHLVMSVVIPPGKADNHLKRVLRRELRSAADTANVEPFTPHELRQRGLTEWSRVNAMAGGIVHGSGLGVLDHYVDPLSGRRNLPHRPCDCRPHLPRTKNAKTTPCLRCCCGWIPTPAGLSPRRRSDSLTEQKTPGFPHRASTCKRHRQPLRRP